jgi:cobalt-zinc-cadmium efflux system membrane fusion protein
MSIRSSFAVMAVVLVGFTVAACSKPGNTSAVDASDDAAHVATGSHTHEGWWCNEHGVPEEVCALCDTSLVAGFKAKGDWCEKHNRPDSQCFICHPEKEAETPPPPEAKYGKQPPKPEA